MSNSLVQHRRNSDSSLQKWTVPEYDYRIIIETKLLDIDKLLEIIKILEDHFDNGIFFDFKTCNFYIRDEETLIRVRLLSCFENWLMT